MKLHRAFTLAAVVLAPFLARGESPDDRYVRVYSLIEEADKLNASGETRSSVTRYSEAQVALKELQRIYPDWNPKIVTYRLNYISTRLDPLTKKMAAPASGSPMPPPVENPLKIMQDEMARLTAQNALLEAKLREALTVQP